MSSNQSSVFLIYTFSHAHQESVHDMATTQLTPRAMQTDKTKQFILEVDEALSTFEEEISSLLETTTESAYENFVTSYRDAMIPIWGPSKLGVIKTVLDTVTDKKFSEFQVMKTKLRKKSPESKVVKEKTKIPTLEDFTDTMQKRLPTSNLLNAATCLKIANVFSNLAEANRAYSQAASGIAELAGEITPGQMTMLLSAATLPAIQIVIPGQLLSPISTPPPPPSAASTTLGKKDIIDYTKRLILPNPKATQLLSCASNSATRVLAAAVYCKLEQHFFEDTQSCAEVAAAFQCNTSQISKVVKGIIYKSGPHHYIPKKQRDETKKKITKRSADAPDTSVVQPPKTQKTTAKKSPSQEGQQSPETVSRDDTLSTPSTSDSDAPLPDPFLNT